MARFGSGDANSARALRGYHHKLQHLLMAFHKSKGKQARRRLVAKMLEEVSAHAEAKERLFFAALGAGSKSNELTRLVDEALEERYVAAWLMSNVQASRISDKRHAANLTMIAEIIQHYVGEQEKGLFHAARATKVALARLEQRARSVPTQRRPARTGRRKAMAHANELPFDNAYNTDRHSLRTLPVVFCS